MSLGYDTVNSAMLGEIGLWMLLAIVAFKILATTVGLGLGLPGGLIGPTLVIGATAGAAGGAIVAQFMPASVSDPALYTMLGMGAMMGATLQAPLAALTALLELTANPNIILPGMLAIVGASLVSNQLFGKESVFIMLMRARGLDYREHPVAQTLRRASIANAMERDLITCDLMLTPAGAKALLQKHPYWLVMREAEQAFTILPAADLARHLESHAEDQINLQEIPALRRQAASIDLRASLQEGLEILQQQSADALVVIDRNDPDSSEVFGIVTREDIEQHYHYRGGQS